MQEAPHPQVSSGENPDPILTRTKEGTPHTHHPHPQQFPPRQGDAHQGDGQGRRCSGSTQESETPDSQQEGQLGQREAERWW